MCGSFITLTHLSLGCQFVVSGTKMVTQYIEEFKWPEVYLRKLKVLIYTKLHKKEL